MRVKPLANCLILSACLLLHCHTQAQEKDTAIDPPKNEEESTQPKTSTIERTVMPVTQWLEKKIQSNTLIQPSIYTDEDKSATGEQQLSLRQAIEKAKEQQTGTVLSAKKTSLENSISYEIKILSEDGIIKLIKIDDQEALKEK